MTSFRERSELLREAREEGRREGARSVLERLTSDETVLAGAEVLVERFERWGVTGHGLDTTGAILGAVAAALSSPIESETRDGD